MQMEGYYSSDEDVAWGPYTLREAKRDIRETVPSKIERRHTYSLLVSALLLVGWTVRFDACRSRQHTIAETGRPANSRGHLNKQHHISEPLTMEKRNQRFENEIANISQKMKSQLNISGTSSEYFTPNETFKSGPTSVDDFLDKMKKVIGEPTKVSGHNEDILEEDTLADKAKSNMNGDNGLVDEIISASHPHLGNQRRQDHSIFNFLKMANPGRGKDSMLGNIEPTLVENTVIISSDEEADDGIVKVEKVSNSFLVNNSCYNTSSEIEMIEISDTSVADANLTDLENSFYLSDMKIETNDEYDARPQDNNLHIDKDLEIQSNEGDIGTVECNTSELALYPNASKKEDRQYQHGMHMQKDDVYVKKYNEGDDEENQFSSLESISNDKPDIEYIIKRLSKDLQDEDVETDSPSVESVDNSKVSTSDFDELRNALINEKAVNEIHQSPEINMGPYSESSHSQNSSMTFNDTLEEMEMVLKYGIDYKMPNDYTTSPKPTNHDADLNSEDSGKMQTPIATYIPPVPLDDATSLGSRIPKPVGGNYNTKITKNHLTPMHPVIQPEHAKSYFKVPCTPSRHRVTPTKSPLSHNKKFKDIISPVGIYIKHSPAAVIKRTLLPKDITTSSRSARIPEEKILKNIENTDLPKVVYRPAKKNIVHKEKEIMLPQSIRKLICEPGVTKHEGRVTSKVCDTSVGVMLDVFEQELTCASIDENALNTTGDTSFLSKKQGFTK